MKAKENPILFFVIDYMDRHKHPVNALLHIFGVPMVFWGLYELFALRLWQASALIVVGYCFQYLGHKAQGNEVGEVILLKKIYFKLRSKTNGARSGD